MVDPRAEARISFLARAGRDLLAASGHPDAAVDVARIDTADDFAAASRALALLLAAIGVIALLVGIIGVTNVGLMSVRERTREFGLRRALGSTPETVSLLVMTETVLVIVPEPVKVSWTPSWSVVL